METGLEFPHRPPGVPARVTDGVKPDVSAWDEIVLFFAGKHVAVLGPRTSGKTVLQSLLLTGEVHHDPEATIGPTPTRSKRNKALDLDIRKGVDLPGAQRAYPDWERQFKRSSTVFFLFDAHLLRTDVDYARRVEEDGWMMKRWGVSDKDVLIMGTHADTDPLRAQVGAAPYSDLILDHDSVLLLQGRCRARATEVGSLLTKDEAMPMLKRLLGR